MIVQDLDAAAIPAKKRAKRAKRLPPSLEESQEMTPYQQARDGALTKQAATALAGSYLDGSPQSMLLTFVTVLWKNGYPPDQLEAAARTHNASLNPPVEEKTLLNIVNAVRTSRRDAYMRDVSLALRRKALQDAPPTTESFVDPDWEARIDWVRPGVMRSSLSNCATLLRFTKYYHKAFRLNLFTGRIEVTRDLFGHFIEGYVLTDDDITELTDDLQQRFGLQSDDPITVRATKLASKEFAYHPIKKYLESLTWDGVERIPTLFIDYVGAEDRELYREGAKCFLISLIARIYKPGCKVDLVVVFEGDEGRGKSDLIRILVGEQWYSSSMPSLKDWDDRSAKMALVGKWGVEMAEMAALLRADGGSIKAFTSCQVDNYRAPYGRINEDHPRQTILIGTTNARGNYIEGGGGRRFLPVPCTKNIDKEKIAEIRDQLLAEGKWRYDNDEPWHLPNELEAELIEENEKRFSEHIWTPDILEYLTSPEIQNRKPYPHVFPKELIEKALRIVDTTKQDAAAKQIYKILHKLRWKSYTPGRYHQDRRARWIPESAKTE
jgi:predicted P-loop ATPase